MPSPCSTLTPALVRWPQAEAPTAALICGAMGKREAATEALGGALLATRLKIGRPEPLSR